MNKAAIITSIIFFYFFSIPASLIANDKTGRLKSRTGDTVILEDRDKLYCMCNDATDDETIEEGVKVTFKLKAMTDQDKCESSEQTECAYDIERRRNRN